MSDAVSEPPDVPDSVDYSEPLRTTRERRDLSVDEVHQATGISVVVIRALEAGDLDQVEPVFFRLGLRTYADFLGLDAESLVAAYDAQRPAPPAVAVPAPGESTGEEESGSMFAGIPRTWQLVGLGGGGLLLLLILISLFAEESANPRSDRPKPKSLPVEPTTAAVMADENRGQQAPSASQPLRPAPTPARASATVSSEPSTGGAHEPAAGSPASDPNLGAADDGADSAPVVALSQPGTPAEDPLTPEAPSDETSVERPTEQTAAALAATTPIADEPVEAGSAPQEPAPTEANEAIPAPASSQGAPEADSLLTFRVEAIDEVWIQIEADERIIYERTVPPGHVSPMLRAREYFRVRSGVPHGMRYWFRGELLGEEGRFGPADGVLNFRASHSGVELLGQSRRASAATATDSLR